MKRLKALGVVTICIISCLVARLFYVSVIDGKSLAKQAVSQRTQKVSFDSPRGIIYDRNMIKITNAKMELIYDGETPYYVDKRNDGLLSHVIGYISPDGNGCGIEGAFDYALSSDGKDSFSYLKDINNNKVSSGYAVDSDKSYKGISLTIDYHIQKITEEAMDKYNVSGAAVMVECESGEIVAMASRPNFDRKNLSAYLGGTQGELVNKAICAYNPGSVFKTVVAAAYLEEVADEARRFSCGGKTTVDGVEFVCHKQDGHGEQDFVLAFANSCNCAFYETGTQLGAETIYKYSSAFGIGDEVMKINKIVESKGYVPKKTASKAEIANVSIGQGDVMVTPLQVADIFCTICNGGVRKQISLIKGIVDETGARQSVAPSDMGRVISETTARRMQDAMRAVVEYGTGQAAQIEGYGAGGKTGSAETGWEKDGEIMQQGWFAGFFPADSPKYVLVVLAENGKSGSESACPVFKEIGENVCKIR